MEQEDLYPQVLRHIQSGDYPAAVSILATFPGAKESDAWAQIAAELLAGERVEKRPLDAIPILRRLAEAGDAHCQQLLGSILVRGRDVAQDVYGGIALLEQAGAQGKTYSLASLSQMYRHGFGPIAVDPGKCVNYLQQAADLGDVETMLTLCGDYEAGFGVQASPEKCFELNRKVAAAGDVRGNFNLGVAYEYGRGVDVNDEDAFKNYYIAANAGIMLAQHNLGARFFNGRGTVQNKLHGINWYMHAAAHDSSLSQHCLGLAFFKGDGVDINPVAALSWFMLALQNGHVESQSYFDNLVSQTKKEDFEKAQHVAENFKLYWREQTADSDRLTTTSD